MTKYLIKNLINLNFKLLVSNNKTTTTTTKEFHCQISAQPFLTNLIWNFGKKWPSHITKNV